MAEMATDRIMGLIYDHFESGAAGMTDSATLARQIGRSVDETDAWVRACERHGWLGLDHAMGEGRASVRALTLTGRLHVEQRRG